MHSYIKKHNRFSCKNVHFYSVFQASSGHNWKVATLCGHWPHSLVTMASVIRYLAMKCAATCFHRHGEGQQTRVHIHKRLPPSYTNIHHVAEEGWHLLPLTTFLLIFTSSLFSSSQQAFYLTAPWFPLILDTPALLCLELKRRARH